jgi:hypothetical protein
MPVPQALGPELSKEEGATATEERQRGEPCPACGGALDAMQRCTACGAAFGELDRCPHCRSISGIEAHPKLRFRCRVCGGPRIPVDDASGVRSGRELVPLEHARREQLRASAFRAGAGFLGASGFFSVIVTVLVLLAIAPGPVPKLLALLVAGLPLALAAYAWRRANRHSAELERDLDEAWLLAAADAASKEPALDAVRLGKRLRIEESAAELLLAELSVQDLDPAAELARERAPSRSRVP